MTFNTLGNTGMAKEAEQSTASMKPPTQIRAGVMAANFTTHGMRHR